MLQTEMGIGVEEGGTLLLLDNQSAIKLAKNPVFHKIVRTLAMAADQLTKHVGVKVLGVGNTLMGMCSG